MAAREPIFGLDLIRLSAAAFVVIYHLAFKQLALHDTVVARVIETGDLPSWWWFTWWGWIGVQIFFVISGTVIAYSMANVSPGTFFRKRVERLYPALLICATIALPVRIAMLQTPPGTALLLYAKTLLFHPSGPWLLGQFWTLPMEAVFYGMMWLVLLVGRADALPKVAWAMGLASAIFWIMVGIGAPLPNGRLSCLLLLQHGCYFAIGIQLAQPVAGRSRALHLLLILICVVTAGVQIRWTAAGERLGHGLADQWIVPFGVWLLTVAAIAASIRYRQAISRRVAASSGLLRHLGRMTYPLYLIHMHAGLPVLLVALPLGVPVPVAVACALVASGVAAAVIAVYGEPPVHRRVAAVLRAGMRRFAVA